MLNKTQRQFAQFLSSVMDSALEKSETSFHSPIRKKEAVVPFFEGCVGRPHIIDSQDMEQVLYNMSSSPESTFFAKSLVVEGNYDTTELTVWLTLPTSPFSNMIELQKSEPIYAIDVAVLDAVSSLLKVNLEKAIVRSNGGVILDTTDSIPYIKTAAFRWLSKIIDGMNDDEVRTIDVPICLSSRLQKDSSVPVVATIRRHTSDAYTFKAEGGTLLHESPILSIPKLASEIMSVFEWYDTEDATIFPEFKISNQEASDACCQIVDEDRAIIATNAINAVTSEIAKPEPNIETLQELVSILQADVLGLKSKLNRLANLTDAEIDIINSSLAILQATTRPVHINIG